MGQNSIISQSITELLVGTLGSAETLVSLWTVVMVDFGELLGWNAGFKLLWSDVRCSSQFPRTFFDKKKRIY